MRRVLWLVPILACLTAAGAPASSPDARSAVQVEEVSFVSGDVELAGRLWRPDGPGPHPAVVFIPGSGRSIRDLELDPDPVPLRFVVRGIAFFAWDKRGVRDSGGTFEPLPDEDGAAQRARLRLLASDAAAAMRHLAGRDDVDPQRIGVWAFSQGGWVATQLEAVGAAPRFLFVVGGPAVSIGEELRYSEIADAARERSRARGGRVELDEIYRELDEARAPEGELGGYDPYPSLEVMKTPTLFLLGEHDLSVPTRRSVERLEELGRLHEWIDYRVFPRASHGVATRDVAGTWYMAEDFYETVFEYLGNLGVVDREHAIEIRPLGRSGRR